MSRKSEAHRELSRRYRPYRMVINIGMWAPVLISPFGETANIISSGFFVAWGVMKYMMWREGRALNGTTPRHRWRPLPTPPGITMPPGFPDHSLPSVPHGLGHDGQCNFNQ